MTKTATYLTDDLYRYLTSHSLREVPILGELRAETAKMTGAQMQISPDQGQFMALLIKLMHAKKIIEIGTFTGYSALVMALAMPPEGEIITCDISPQSTDVAQRYWQKANVANKIQLNLAPALETLEKLLATQANTFDFAFIDADKRNYVTYYEKCLALVRPGGLIAIDNVLWGGSVIDTLDQGADTQAIRALNEHLLLDHRVEISMIPIGDGLTLARKRDAQTN